MGNFIFESETKKALINKTLGLWAPGDLNPEPTDYESGALTVELGALQSCFVL